MRLNEYRCNLCQDRFNPDRCGEPNGCFTIEMKGPSGAHGSVMRLAEHASEGSVHLCAECVIGLKAVIKEVGP